MRFVVFFITAMLMVGFVVWSGQNHICAHPKGAYQPLVTGTWAEIWGKEGWESNVNYIDTVVVDKDQKGDYFMYCTNKAYFRYDRISYDGNTFSFRMYYSSSMNSDFYVNYWLRFVDNPDELVGESRNSREDKNFVRMKRLK